MSEDIPYVVRDRVRFRDLDSSGHVNNSVYANFVEEARAAIFGQLGEFILARLEIDFRDQTRFGEEIEVRTRCSRLGSKSLDLEHSVFASGRLVAEAKSVVVAYDFVRSATLPIPQEWRRKLTPSSF